MRSVAMLCALLLAVATTSACDNNPATQVAAPEPTVATGQALPHLDSIARPDGRPIPDREVDQPTDSDGLPAAEADVPAFRGAEGYGAGSRGGRGGRVLFVTHTGDRGSGSLRACVQARGPRTCVFRTGGTIHLGSPLRVGHPNVTIAGQTAPGDGIQIRNDRGRYGPVLIIRTHDVVVRYLRLRAGEGNGRQRDAVSIRPGAADVILDHVTVMFAEDELLGAKVTGSRPGDIHDITVQRSLLANIFLSHPTATLWASSDGQHGLRNVSLHHNVFANAGYRTPLVGSTLRVEAVNNVIYNWPAKSAVVNGNADLDLINTYYRAGPTTSANANLLQVDRVGPRMSLHVTGLVADPGKPDAGRDDWAFVQDPDGGSVPLHVRRNTSHARSAGAARFPIRVEDARGAYRGLVEHGDVGAWRGLACDGEWRDVRDALDARTLADVRNGTRAGARHGNYPSRVEEYGGYPSLAAGSPCPDADEDGMPDAFERRHGLNPDDAGDASLDPDDDGYASFEEYLDGASPRSAER